MNRTRLFIAACAGMFLFGVSLVLLGTLFGLPAMRERLELTSLVRQGNLQTLLFFGLFVSTIVGGPLIDRFGHKLVLSLSAALVAVSLLGYAYASGYRAAELFTLALGVGGGGLNMATNVLVSDIYGDDRGAKLNHLGVFFGVGALFMPFITAWVAEAIIQLVLVAAGLSAIAAVAYAMLKFPEAHESGGGSILDAFKAVRYPGVLLFGVLLFFESANESAVVGWLSTWSAHLGASVRSATLTLALFQAMMMSGRLLAAPILKGFSKPQLVLASAIGSIAATTVVATATSATMFAVGAALTGLTFASIYPTILALAGDRYQRYAGTVFSILFAIGLAGGMFYPWAIGHISESQGVRAGMVLPVIGTLAITLLFLTIRARYLVRAQESSARA